MSTAVFGAPEWLARSGRTIKPLEDGTITFQGSHGYLAPRTAMDVEEYFQAKRDQDLGRWRWPEDPDFVVYRRAEDGHDLAVVFRESDGTQAAYDRDDFPTSDSDRWLSHREAAHAFFETHPDRKPWEEAEDGQMWLLRFDDFPATDVSALVKSGRFVYNDHCHEGVTERTDPTISAGRRIWPVDETAPAELHESSSQAGLASIRGGL